MNISQNSSDQPTDDASALAQWFVAEVQPHESRLRTWVRCRFPWVTDIDNLVQESFARLLKAKNAGKIDHTRSYLYATARNAAFDLGRRDQVATIQGVADLTLLSVLEDRPDAAESLSHDEELEILAAAIEALPKRCRLVVKLRKLRGRSHRQIAEQLGISENTVNAQLAKGLELCRAYLRSRGLID